MKRSVFLAVIMFFVFSAVAFAQDETAVETLEGLEAYAPWLVALVTGYVGSKLTKILSGIGWLSTDSQLEITKLVKVVLGMTIPAVMVVGIKELTPLAQHLDTTEIWPLIVACITFAKGTHILDRKFNTTNTVNTIINKKQSVRK